MSKYIRVEWPEIQKFMDISGWNQCYYGFSEDQEFDEDKPSCYFVPEDLYNKVMNKLEFPKKYENTNLGTIVCYETRAVVNDNKSFWYDESDIKKGNIALIYDENGNWHTSKIIACSNGFPIMLEDSEFVIGINCELVGHYNPEMPF